MNTLKSSVLILDVYSQLMSAPLFKTFENVLQLDISKCLFDEF